MVAFFGLALLGLFGGPWLWGKLREPPESAWKFHLVGLVLAIILGVCALFAPWRYSVTPELVKVHSGLGSYAIPLSQIMEIKTVQARQFFRGVRRTCGRAVFGYAGQFATPEYPKIQVDSGSLSGDLVFISTSDGEIYVIGPKNPEKFVEYVNDMRKQ